MHLRGPGRDGFREYAQLEGRFVASALDLLDDCDAVSGSTLDEKRISGPPYLANLQDDEAGNREQPNCHRKPDGLRNVQAAEDRGDSWSDDQQSVDLAAKAAHALGHGVSSIAGHHESTPPEQAGKHKQGQ